ncbi:MAG: AAA family ATPase [Oscillochloris sp.]|nr:AAA family ATPase [Oscillochloris sp.]
MAASQVIALIGLSGVGKSAVARILAERLGLPAVDIDGVVAEAAGMPVAQIFAQYGEAAFRAREAAALVAALNCGPQVIATGGGAVLSEENRSRLRQAFVVWLDAPDDVILARLRADGEQRPLLQTNPAARIAALRAERNGFYHDLANLTIVTSYLSPAAVADRIARAYRPDVL